MFTSKSTLFKAALSAILLAVSMKVGIFSIETVAAAPFRIGSGVEVSGALGDDMVKMIGKLAFVNTFMHIMLLIVLQFLGYLLQADFFNDPVMMGALNTIWQLSRDIMNVIFALMLIAVSFLVIITGKTDKAKEKVVNFIVAVVLVNFSWFFPRVILDVANILTATVYTIPSALGNFSCFTIDQNNARTECRVITDAIIFPTAAESAGAYCGGPDSISCSCSDNIECHKSDTFSRGITTMTPAHAMLNGLAVSFARVSVLSQVPTTIAGLGGGGLNANQAVRVSFQVAMSIFLAFVIQIAVLLPLLGLAIGLFIRIIILWVTTAFMPFSFLGYVINGKLGTDVFEFETNIWKEFLNAAFLPAMVAIPLVIGFVMLTTVAQMPAPPGMFALVLGVPILAGVKTWWQLLWTMAAIGILWTGAFKALSKSKLVGGFTDKIKGFGESIFGGLAQAPLLIPIPLPGGAKGTNLGTLVHGPKILADSVRAAASGTTGKSFSDIVKSRFGMGDNGSRDPTIITDNLNRAARQNTQDIIKAVQDLNGGLVGNDRQVKFDEIRKNLGVDAGLSNRETIDLLKKMMTVKNPNEQLKTIKIDIENLKE